MNKLFKLLYNEMSNTLTDNEEKELVEIQKKPGLKPFIDEFHDCREQEVEIVQRIGNRKENVWTGIIGKIESQNRSQRIIRGSISALLILISVSSFYYFTSARDILQPKLSATTDILPIEGNAILTREDGTRITLFATDTTMPKQPGYLKGFYTISTEKGKQFKLTLSDGTKVWLNAGSSLRYPATFNPAKRQVYISGEAFFDVKASKSNPFIVTANNIDVRVLGTQFNISAYLKQQPVRVSLIKGSVQVTNHKKIITLKPGHQAFAGDSMQVRYFGDTSRILSWQDDKFRFQNTPLTEILAELQQYYDFEVEFDKDYKDVSVVGTFRKNLPLSEILSVIASTGVVSIEIENNTAKVRIP